ncbi:MAG: LLM class flavin-dependent oxidoreductase [Candidatus Methylomirabilales bacterium]
MNVGFFLTGAAQATYNALLEQVHLGEEAGFDAVWLRDRHFHQDFVRHPFSSPFVVIAHLAALFKRIRFGIGCKVLPLDHHLHVAEDAATVDVLSGGRLELGVARGGEHALCRAGFGVQDHIPAAQRVSDIERTLELYMKLREEAGLSAEVAIPINRFAYVAESKEQALADMEQPFMAFMFKDTDIREYLFMPDRAITYERLLEDVAIFGDPETCFKKIEHLKVRLGLQYLIFTFNYHTLDHPKSLRSMVLFAQHILPSLKSDAGG